MKNTVAKLQFNDTTYEFLIQRTRVNKQNDTVVEKTGAVLINGVVEYILWYSYDIRETHPMAVYEIFDVEDTEDTAYLQRGDQDFPFYMVQSMVQYLMKRRKP